MKPTKETIDSLQVDEDTGAEIIQDLMLFRGALETREKALAGWRAMSEEERAKTVTYHYRLTSGEPI